MNLSCSKIVYFSLIVMIVINVNILSKSIVKFVTRRRLKHIITIETKTVDIIKFMMFNYISHEKLIYMQNDAKNMCERQAR